MATILQTIGSNFKFQGLDFFRETNSVKPEKRIRIKISGAPENPEELPECYRDQNFSCLAEMRERTFDTLPNKDLLTLLIVEWKANMRAHTREVVARNKVSKIDEIIQGKQPRIKIEEPRYPNLKFVGVAFALASAITAIVLTILYCATGQKLW